MDEYIEKKEAIDALLNKGQKSRRYKLGETWELNLFEIEEAITEAPSADVQPALNEKEYESLCKRMAECANMDVEDGHIAADDILLEALEKMGYEKLVALYQDLDKWYA